MKITLALLSKMNACEDGRNWFVGQKQTNSIKVLRALLADNKENWANWLVCRLLSQKQRIKYAIFAAEQVIDIFERKYPDDKRPREAIRAAKAVLRNDTTAPRAADAAYAATAMRRRIVEYGIGMLSKRTTKIFATK